MTRTLLFTILLLSVFCGFAAGGEQGVQIFGRCVPCHKGNGEGSVGLYPPLVKHAPEIVLTNRTYLISVLLYGLQGKIQIKSQKVPYDGIMPAFNSLADTEVAAVLNYILTSWGNDKILPKGFAPITADEVKSQRGQNLTPRNVYDIRQRLRWSK